jgi:hypothetical protein
MANEKPKEGVTTGNNDHINFKVVGRMVPWCTLRLRGIHNLVTNESILCMIGFANEQIRF